jgi:hypothetical protein
MRGMNMRFRIEKVKLETAEGTEEFTMYPPKGEYLTDVYKIIQSVMKHKGKVKPETELSELPFDPEVVSLMHKVTMHCLEKKHIKDKDDREELDFIVSQNLFTFVPALLKVIGSGNETR